MDRIETLRKEYKTQKKILSKEIYSKRKFMENVNRYYQ